MRLRQTNAEVKSATHCACGLVRPTEQTPHASLSVGPSMLITYRRGKELQEKLGDHHEVMGTVRGNTPLR
jgi:hypothetical protein